MDNPALINTLSEIVASFLFRPLLNIMVVERGQVQDFAITLGEDLSEKVKYSKIGESTDLLEIEEFDMEALFIGGNLKYARIGCGIYFSIHNSSPIELARERVLERLKLLDDRFNLKVVSDSFDGSEYDEIGFNNCTYSQDSLFILPHIVPEGMSMTNRNQKHFGWLPSLSGRYGDSNLISADRKTYERIKSLAQIRKHKCPVCETTMLATSGLCPVCKATHARCDECDKYFEKTKMTYIDSKWVCEECAKAPRCRGCGHKLSSNHDRICHYCEDIPQILDYHSGRGRRDESEESRFKVGLEVEKEDSRVKYEIDTKEILRESGWVVERDGSLSDESGFELISPVYPLNLGFIRDRVIPIEKYLNANVSNKCGGHIHISDTERTPHEILLDIRGYLPLLYGLYPQRATNEYCEAKEVDTYLDSGHRQAINLTNKTLEFRIFPAVKDVDHMMFRLELVEYLMKHKETEVVNVGQQLLDKDSRLYKILNKRISTENIQKKAEAFIDFTNYLDRDAIVLKGGKMERVIKIPKIKLEKNKLLEARVKDISNHTRRRDRDRVPSLRKVDLEQFENEYGYWVNLIKKNQ